MLYISFINASNGWWLVPTGIIALGISYWFYFIHYKGNLHKTQRLILSMLRMASLLLVLVLLSHPVIKQSILKKQKPIVLFASDNSQSMVSSSDSVFVKNELKGQVAKALAGLEANFDLETIQFGEKTDSLRYDFRDRETNFSDLFQYIQSKYYNKNLGALILATDGIYTRGENPLFAARDANYQIFTLALGDTLPRRNIKIKQIDYNKIVYKGSMFPVFVNLDAYDMTGKNVELQIIRNERIIQKQQIEVDEKYFFKKIAFTLPADSVGMHTYTVKIVSDLPDKDDVSNQQKKINIEVSDKTKHILLLFENYHPDIAVFNRAISSNPVFTLDISSLRSKPDSLNKYALVILYQLPSASSNISDLYRQLLKHKIPLFYVLGEKTFIDAFNAQNNQYQILQGKAFMTDAFPELNSGFSLFNLNSTQELLHAVPPLQVPFGDYQELPGNQILMYQSVGNIRTQRPLMCFMESGEIKTAYLFGEGIWRWSLQEFKQFQNHAFTHELITKSIQYLVQSKQNEWIDLEIPVNHPQHIPLKVKARLYNASNEIITGNELQFNLIDASQNSYPFIFQQERSSYALNLGLLEEGSYKYQVKATIGDSIYKKNGRFFVMENTIEKNDLKARHQELYSLAHLHGGIMVHPDDMEALVERINTTVNLKPTYIETNKFKDLLDVKLLFGLLLLCIAADWFLRKIWGTT